MPLPDIKIGRYNTDAIYAIGPDGERESCGWSGYIEDGDMSWILFLNDDGKPALYWGERDEGGGVVGEPVELGPLTPAT